MATAYTSPLLALASNDGYPPSPRPPFGRLLAISLTLHAGALFIAETVRLLDFSDGPLVVQTVTLVTLPQEPRATARPAAVPKREPQPAAPKPVQPAAPKPAPPPATRVEPTPDAAPRQEPPPDVIQEARVRSEALMQQALDKIKLPAPPVPAERPPEPPPPKPRAVIPAPLETPPPPAPPARDRLDKTLDEIELPPDAPTFKRLSPVPAAPPRRTLPPPPATPSAPPPPSREPVKPVVPSRQLGRDISQVLKKLDVPDAPAVPAVPPPDRRVPTRKPRTSLSDNLQRELEVLEKLNRPEPVPAVPLPTPAPRSSATQVAKADPSASAALQPATSITMDGGGRGTNEYQALIQMLINKQWIAPPVDLSGKPLSVVVKFRIHRSGTISNVTVKEPSGNPYYDLAAKRAVLSADPLPPFPGTMSESYLDAHYTFSVKEPVS